MRKPEEIKADLAVIDENLAKLEADLETERDKIRAAAKITKSMIGKARTSARQEKAKLVAEYGAAVLAGDAPAEG